MSLTNSVFVSLLYSRFISNIHHFSHFLSRLLLCEHCRAVKTLAAKFIFHLTHTRTEKAAGEDGSGSGGGSGWRGGLSIAPEGLISPTLFVYYCMRSDRQWRGNNKHGTVASGFLLMPPADARIRTAGGAACDAALMYSERLAERRRCEVGVETTGTLALNVFHRAN